MVFIKRLFSKNNTVYAVFIFQNYIKNVINYAGLSVILIRRLLL